MMKTNNDLYLERFFEEKELNYQLYEVDHDGLKHFIDSEMIIELIQSTNDQEKNQIIMQLRKLDRLNGDIHHFLKFLAEQYIKMNY